MLSSRSAVSLLALFLFVLVLVCTQFAYILTAAFSQSPLLAPRLACTSSGKGGKPIGSARDCEAGQGSECSFKQPCTPCSAGGCLPCSRSDQGSALTGECFFLPGQGPYCSNPDAPSAPPVPCTKCCTDA